MKLNLFWSHVNKSGPVPEHRRELGPCWLWTGSTVTGYGRGGNRENGVRHDWLAHRKSWEIETGDQLGPLEQINHHCDNRLCVRPEHLFKGTQTDNLRDMVLKGRNKGLYQGRLTPEKVREIRLLNGVFTHRQIGARYGISHTMVGYILRGKKWQYV